MTIEEIIQQILLQRPELTRDTLLEELRVEKSKTGGLITDETLLRLIAAKYGVEVFSGVVYDCRLSISQLVPNLGDVGVSGRVVAVFPSRTFEGKTSGKYASLVVVDGGGILRVMLWNGVADLVESGGLRVGQLARFSHGYTRVGRDGKVELHLGDRSEVEVDPEGLRVEDFPDIDRFATKVKDLAGACGGVHLVGVVRRVFPVSRFTRQDLSGGRVLRFVLADDSGEVVVVVWNEKAEELEGCLKRDVSVQLVNGLPKVASNGGFEVHVGSLTYVGVSSV